MRNPMRHILYQLNENSNNPATLLVGEDVKVNRYEGTDTADSFLGTVELITNDEVVVTNRHTDESYNFIFNGFNAHENAVEFVNDNDPNLRFYVY